MATAAEVVVRIEDDSPLLPNFTTSNYPIQEHPMIIVRAEEILLVVLVLIIWVAAIALFFNRWGKIRMLEPYQPKFQQAHRPSCPIAVDTGVNTGCSISDLRKQRMSFSKFNVNCLGDSTLYSALPSPRLTLRPRQNSVFAGSTNTAIWNPPRRVKSAMDIQHLTLGGDTSLHSLSDSSSLLPMPIGHSPTKDPTNVNRRPSINVERPSTSTTTIRRRPSTCHDFSCHVPLLSRRRPSCFTDNRYSYGRQKFISFDQPSCSNWDRRTSINIERSPGAGRNRPSISLERSPLPLVIQPSTSTSPIQINMWDRRPSVTIEPPPPQTPPETEEENIESIISSKSENKNLVIVDIEKIKPRGQLKKQTTINLDNIVIGQPYINNLPFKKSSISFDHPCSINSSKIGKCPTSISAESAMMMTTIGIPSQTASDCITSTPESSINTFSLTNSRLCGSLDRGSKWTTTPNIELQLLETETESKQVTNV